MTGDDLAQLLRAAADAAEPDAPAVDPLHALARERRRHQRRGHLAALSFVVLVLALQAAAPDAAGAGPSAGTGAGIVAAPAPAPAPAADRPARHG